MKKSQSQKIQSIRTVRDAIRDAILAEAHHRVERTIAAAPMGKALDPRIGIMMRDGRPLYYAFTHQGAEITESLDLAEIEKTLREADRDGRKNRREVESEWVCHLIDEHGDSIGGSEEPTFERAMEWLESEEKALPRRMGHTEERLVAAVIERVDWYCGSNGRSDRREKTIATRGDGAALLAGGWIG